MTITIERWGERRPRRCSSARTRPEMTQLPRRARDARRSSSSGRRATCACGRPARRACSGSSSTARPVGGIGYWQVEHDGVPAWETGWSVEPEWQGRGIAREALRLVIRRVADDGSRGAARRVPGRRQPAVERAVPPAPGSSIADRRTLPWRGGELDVQHLGARHVAARPRRAHARRRRALRRGIPRRDPLVAVLHAALVVTGALRRPVRPHARRPRAADRRGHPAVGSRPRRRPARLAPADRAALGSGRQRDRPASIPARPGRARSPAGASRVAAPLRRHRGADGGHPPPRGDGRLLADRLRGAARRLRRALHRRDLRVGPRRRRRLGGRRREAAERPAAARSTSRRSASTATSPTSTTTPSSGRPSACASSSTAAGSRPSPSGSTIRCSSCSTSTSSRMPGAGVTSTPCRTGSGWHACGRSRRGERALRRVSRPRARASVARAPPAGSPRWPR